MLASPIPSPALLFSTAFITICHTMYFYSLIISLSFLHNESFPFHITLDVIFITLNSHTYEFISLFLWLFPLMLVYFYTIELFL